MGMGIKSTFTQGIMIVLIIIAIHFAYVSCTCNQIPESFTEHSPSPTASPPKWRIDSVTNLPMALYARHSQTFRKMW
jgi:hypothetical protein